MSEATSSAIRERRSATPATILGAAGALLAGFAALALLLHGFSEEAVRLVVRASAKLAILFFAAAFSASSLQSLRRTSLSRWMLRNRRYLGLSFALSHGVHLAALIVLGLAFPDPFVGDLDALTLVGGGIAYAFLFAMALTSTDAAVARLGRRRWRRLHTVGSYYIWVIFVQSYVPRALLEPEYIPWALVTVAPIAPRIARRLRMRRARRDA